MLLGKKRRFRKLICNYISFRIKGKRIFNEQVKRLDTMLQDKVIKKDTYERLRIVLEVNDLQQQQEKWEKMKNKFCNPIKS